MPQRNALRHFSWRVAQTGLTQIGLTQKCPSKVLPQTQFERHGEALQRRWGGFCASPHKI